MCHITILRPQTHPQPIVNLLAGDVLIVVLPFGAGLDSSRGDVRRVQSHMRDLTFLTDTGRQADE